MMRVFVSAPFSAPTPEAVLDNVHRAIDCGQRLDESGVITAYVPHLYLWWDRRHPAGYERWMEKCAEELRRSDALLRLDASPGADRELALAKEIGLPLFLSEERCVLWATWVSGGSVAPVHTTEDHGYRGGGVP